MVLQLKQLERLEYFNLRQAPKSCSLIDQDTCQNCQEKKRHLVWECLELQRWGKV